MNPRLRAVAHTVSEWYRGQKQSGISPVVRHVSITTVAWLKRPSLSSNAKLHELVATCSAALQPSPKMWATFIHRLKQLKTEGKVTSDELVAVVANELIQPRMLEGDEPDYSDATTLDEVIERVRAEHAAEARTAIAEAEAIATGAEARATRSAEQSRQLDLRLTAWFRRIASATAAAAFYGAGVVVAIGALLLVPGILPADGPLRVLGWSAAMVLAVATWWNLVFGTHLDELRVRFQAWLEKRIRQRFLDPESGSF